MSHLACQLNLLLSLLPPTIMEAAEGFLRGGWEQICQRPWPTPPCLTSALLKWEILTQNPGVCHHKLGYIAHIYGGYMMKGPTCSVNQNPNVLRPAELWYCTRCVWARSVATLWASMVARWARTDQWSWLTRSTERYTSGAETKTKR